MALSRFFKSRAKRRVRSWRAADEPPPRRVREDPLDAYRGEASMLDTVLEDALETLPSLTIPGRFALWLAQFPIEQAGNDVRVRRFEAYLSSIAWSLHAFVHAGRELPDELRTRLTDVGLGPDAFGGLLDDPRLTTQPRAPRRAELERFLQQLRERVRSALTELEHQSERGYR